MRITKVSPTRLKTAKTCEFKYFLNYQWGWGDELFLYTFASEFGTAVHNTLEQYALHKGKVDYKVEYLKQITEQKPFS
jgi:ATP-dependent helicase/DNAse subunit B